MQGRRGAAQGPGIVFDSDMGRNIDAALALAMLYNLGPKGQVIAVGVSNSSLEAAQFCDAVGRFYKGDHTLSDSGTRAVLPVGLADDGPKLGNSPMLTVPLAMKNAEGAPLFPRNVNEVRDTADVRILFRNALLTQKDGEAIAVLAGPATDLARTLALKDARDVIAAKASLLVAAIGTYPEGADARVKADVGSARQLFANWPGPIVAVGTEVGAALPYAGAGIESDFTWSKAHPIVEAYRAFHAAPYDAPGQALVAVLYAANQTENYCKLSEPGTISVTPDGRTHFVAASGGKHRYLRVDPAQKERVQKAIAELVSAQPAQPAGRGRG